MIDIYHSTSVEPMLKKVAKAKKGSWVHAIEPTEEELLDLSETYNLDYDLLEDATDIYEAPRVERDGQNIYIYTRYCAADGHDIATEPLLIVYTADHIVTIMRRATDVLRDVFTGKVPIVTSQRTKTILQLLEAINISYEHHMKYVSRRVLSIRTQLSKTELKNEDFIEFIDIEEDLNEFLTALQPQESVFKSLLRGKYIPLYEDDKDLVEDLSLNSTELMSLVQSRQKTIANTREAYATIAANTLNKTFKKLTSISIFMTIPAITAGLYGMNLTLPLQRSKYAFWEILTFVMVMTGLTVWYFRKKRWL